MNRLAGKYALITGASRGLGRVSAQPVKVAPATTGVAAPGGVGAAGVGSVVAVGGLVGGVVGGVPPAVQWDTTN